MLTNCEVWNWPSGWKVATIEPDGSEKDQPSTADHHNQLWKGRAVHVCHILGVTLPSSGWVFRMFGAAITKLTTNHFTIWKLLLLWITSTW